MEAIQPRHVLIGATFACDESLETPLQLLLRHAVDGVDARLDWLPYGSALLFDSWRSRAAASDLVILLIRVKDLEADHPELNATGQSTALNLQCLETRLIRQLRIFREYPTLPPLVLLLCPSWCDGDSEKYKRSEDALVSTLQSLSPPSNVHVVHVTREQLAAFGFSHENEYCDLIAEKREHLPFTRSMMDTLALLLVRQITRLFRKSKKVVVLDCDNTLWAGAVAELGVMSIQIHPEHVALQQFMVQLQRRGLVLCLCSKNLEKDVLDVFHKRRDDMVLQLDDHIVTYRINWQPKSENIRQIAHELSLGLDSFIFVDDNPIECNEVSSNLPMVQVVQVPSSLPSTIAPCFALNEWVFDESFETRSVTSEDAKRTQFYRENIQRQKYEQSLGQSSAFLSSLGVRITFEKVASPESPIFDRALQLHQRTNQFNVSTSFSRQVDRQLLEQYIQKPGHNVLCASVTDRFGHYGLVGVCLFRGSSCSENGNSGELFVDSLLLSCRALNRGVEHEFMKRIADHAMTNGYKNILIAWERTARNDPAMQFLESITSATLVKSSSESVLATRDAWQICVDDALKISFLIENTVDKHATNTNKLTRWEKTWSFVLQLCRRWLSRAAHVACWFLGRVQTRMALCGRTLSLRGRRSVSNNHHVGLLKYPLHQSITSLEKFLNQNRSVQTDDSKASKQTEQSEEELCKFRRKARHQAKVVLLDHLADGNVRTVWSANRLTRAPVDERINCVVCLTASCSSVIPKNAICRYKRCRNCCYRIQRLFHRHRHHTHPQAREHAAHMLRQRFQVDGNTSREDEDTSCGAHQNPRRVAD